jgi:hypothetical protein
VRDRPGHVAGEVVTDEQHLAGRAPCTGQDQVIEELRRLPHAQRIGQESQAEQAVYSGALERGPPFLAGCRFRRDQEGYPVLVQRPQLAGGREVNGFLAEQVIDRIKGQCAAVT